VGAGRRSSRVLWALGAIHQWWLLVRRPVGIILGQRRVVVLSGRRRVVVRSWPGVVFRRRVRSVVAWSLSSSRVAWSSIVVVVCYRFNDDEQQPMSSFVVRLPRRRGRRGT